MRILIYFLLFLSFENLFAQENPKETFDIEIIEERWMNKRSKKYGEPKKSMHKTDFLKYSFDKNGNVLEKIKYGTAHYNNFDVIGEKRKYYYENNRLNLEKFWVVYCEQCDNQLNEHSYKKYSYDSKGNLIEFNSFLSFNDSLSLRIIYKYDSLGNHCETDRGNTSIRQYFYDSENKLIRADYRYEGELHSQYTYEYTNTSSTIKWQRFDKGISKDEASLEYRYFNKNKQLIERIYVFSPSSNLKDKDIYYYNENGIIKLIEHYETFYEDGTHIFKKIGFTKYTTHYKNQESSKIATFIAKRINDELDLLKR